MPIPITPRPPPGSVAIASPNARADLSNVRTADFLAKAVEAGLNQTVEPPSPFTPSFVAGLPTASTFTGVEPTVVVQGGVLKQAPLGMFTSPKAGDLTEVQALTDEFLLVYSQGSNQERRIANKHVGKLFSGGVINPKLYGCKGDARRVKDAGTASGSNVIQSASALFHSSDVGKFVALSNAGPGNTPLYGSITQYDSPTQVRMSVNASVSRYNEMIWGTDDTAGMTQAFLDCRSPGTYVYGGVLDLGVGTYLTGPMQSYARMGIVGRGPRQSGFMRKPTPGSSEPLLKNAAATDDFLNMRGFSLDGAKYMQPYTNGSRGFEWTSVTADQNLPQVDPYPQWHDIHIFEASWDGAFIRNRHSGEVTGLSVYGCWGIGIIVDCYDISIATLLAIGNRQAGIDVRSANNNLMNVKASFNGDQDSPTGAGFVATSCNLRVSGSGNNFSNVRLQECPGDNLVIEGPRNKFGDLACDDTGCMRIRHAQGPQTLRSIRAGIRFFANTAVDNVVRAAVSYNVHSTSDATHGVFMSNNASYNQVELFTPHDMTWSSAGAASSGTAAPGVTGYDSSGGFGTGNRVVHNGTTLSP